MTRRNWRLKAWRSSSEPSELRWIERLCRRVLARYVRLECWNGWRRWKRPYRRYHVHRRNILLLLRISWWWYRLLYVLLLLRVCWWWHWLLLLLHH